MSIPIKKVDAYESDLELSRVKLTANTDRGEYSGDGTLPAVTVYAAGREYTVTDNPGGTPVPKDIVPLLAERASALGYGFEEMGKADTDVDPAEERFPGGVKGKSKSS